MSDAYSSMATWPGLTSGSSGPVVATTQTATFWPGMENVPTLLPPLFDVQASGTPWEKRVAPFASFTVTTAAGPKKAW